MKKLLAIILVVAILLPIAALADLPDVTGMTDQELKDLISACSQELRARNTSEPEGILLFEYEGIRIYQTGDAYTSSSFLYVPIAVYNDNDYGVGVMVENANINGWDVYSDGCMVSGKGKNKDDIAFSIEDADVKAIDQIESLKFTWRVFNTDSYDTIYEQKEREEHRFW